MSKKNDVPSTPSLSSTVEEPTQGGSYMRDAETGELVLVEQTKQIKQPKTKE